jgi:hypothetical protein
VARCRMFEHIIDRGMSYAQKFGVSPQKSKSWQDLEINILG